MLIVYESKRSMEEVCAAMEPTVQKHKFGVMTTHNLKEVMASKGVDFDKDCYVFEICNPHQAKKVLDANLEVSSALPCRVSVYRQGGRVKIATLRPTALLAVFNAPDLAPVAQEVEDVITAIMREVAG
ncbi:MAG: DUF302 domain-containing protein [Acidobacteriota bacterium]